MMYYVEVWICIYTIYTLIQYEYILPAWSEASQDQPLGFAGTMTFHLHSDTDVMTHLR